MYDSYENDIGFVQSDEQGDHNHQIIEGIDRSKVITFYTWGKRKHDPIQCDVVFDATLFSTKISVDVKCLSGLDDIIQQSIINHPNFDPDAVSRASRAAHNLCLWLRAIDAYVSVSSAT